METNDLKIFQTVASLKSMSKAANQLGYVQSNISKRIAKLESDLNAVLFTRRTQGMELTEAGIELLSYANQLLTIVASLEQQFSIEPAQVNRIGGTQTIVANYLTDYYQDEEIILHVGKLAELSDMLESCQLEWLVTNRQLTNATFECLQEKNEHLYWSTGTEMKQSPLAIVVSRDPDCPYRQVAIEAAQQLAQPYRMIEVDTFDILLRLVTEQQMLTVLPEIAIKKHGLTKVPLSDLPATRLYVYKRKTTKGDFPLVF